MITYFDAVQELTNGGALQGPSDGDISLIEMKKGVKKPKESDIQAKIAELELAEPLRLLREERTRLLQATDWWATSDRTITNDQKIYRQKLRDLPSVASPSLDENEQLTSMTWPTKPDGWKE